MIDPHGLVGLITRVASTIVARNKMKKCHIKQLVPSDPSGFPMCVFLNMHQEMKS